MTDLSDFQRRVHDPMHESYVRTIRERDKWKSLALHMGETLRSYRYSAERTGETRFEKTDALLARLDQLGKEQA